MSSVIKRFILGSMFDELYPHLGHDELRRVRLTNYISLIVIGNMLMYGILYLCMDAHLFKPAILIILPSCIIPVFVMLINSKGFFMLAKVCLTLFNLLIMSVVATLLFGKDPGFQVFLLLACLIPVFLWSFKQKGYIIFFISLSILAYVLAEFFPPVFPHLIQLPKNYADFFRSTNVLICFMGAALAIGVFIELANKKEAQLEMQSIQLKKSGEHRDFIYSIIAHDLRSPFNGLMGLTKLLSKEYSSFSDEKRLKMIQAIYISSDGLYNLLGDLLDWSRMQTGTWDKNFKHIKIKECVNEILFLLNEVILSKKINLENEIPSDLIVQGDFYMISTILRNLINNAIKFTHEGGSIRVQAQARQGAIEFCVSDNGVGIPESKLPDLFEMQSKHITLGTHNEKGSGLGLKICKDFVHAHGGEIWVESQWNKGSKFYFSLKPSHCG